MQERTRGARRPFACCGRQEESERRLHQQQQTAYLLFSRATSHLLGIENVSSTLLMRAAQRIANLMMVEKGPAWPEPLSSWRSSDQNQSPSLVCCDYHDDGSAD